MIGAIGLGIIEVKSIFEKAEYKVRNDYQQVLMLAGEIAKHRTDPEEITKAVVDYINKGSGK